MLAASMTEKNEDPNTFAKQLATIRRAWIPHLAAFVALAAVLVAVDWHVVDQYKQRAEAAEHSLDRYKQLVELAKPANRTVLTELSNSDLKRMATRLYKGIREMYDVYTARQLENLNAWHGGDITEKSYNEDRNKLWFAMSQEFQRDFRVDVGAVRRELRNRLPREAWNNVPQIPSLVPADPRFAEIPMDELLPPDMVIGFIDQIATELESLTKLLPEK
jgi:hypothetical protein